MKTLKKTKTLLVSITVTSLFILGCGDESTSQPTINPIKIDVVDDTNTSEDNPLVTNRRFIRDDIANIIRDTNTSLIWQDNQEVGTITKMWVTDDKYPVTTDTVYQLDDTSGDTATTYCTDLTLGDISNWRLPTKDELSSLIVSTQTPKIDKAFLYMAETQNNFWTSSETSEETIGLSNDIIDAITFDGLENYIFASKNLKLKIRCVSGENENPSENIRTTENTTFTYNKITSHVFKDPISHFPEFSTNADNNIVVFSSYQNPFNSQDDNLTNDIYLYDTENELYEKVSTALYPSLESCSSVGHASYLTHRRTAYKDWINQNISDDGSLIVFLASSPTFTDGVETKHCSDFIVLYNRSTQTQEVIQSDLYSGINSVGISGNGKVIFFTSSDETLMMSFNGVDSYADAQNQLYMYNIETKNTSWIGTYQYNYATDTVDKYRKNNYDMMYYINKDATDILYTANFYIHKYNISTETHTLIDVNNNNEVGRQNTYPERSMYPSMTADGRYVTFMSEADNLGNPNANRTIYLRDTLESNTSIFKFEDLNIDYTRPAIGNNGRYLYFVGNPNLDSINPSRPVFSRYDIENDTMLLTQNYSLSQTTPLYVDYNDTSVLQQTEIGSVNGKLVKSDIDQNLTISTLIQKGFDGIYESVHFSDTKYYLEFEEGKLIESYGLFDSGCRAGLLRDNVETKDMNFVMIIDPKTGFEQLIGDILIISDLNISYGKVFPIGLVDTDYNSFQSYALYGSYNYKVDALPDSCINLN